jgi:hypothetical protein
MKIKRIWRVYVTRLVVGIAENEEVLMLQYSEECDTEKFASCLTTRIIRPRRFLLWIETIEEALRRCQAEILAERRQTNTLARTARRLQSLANE